MSLKKIQNIVDKFNEERGWKRFPPSQIFTHLVEELGELGRYILYDEGYKKQQLGHKPIDGSKLEREFAQVTLLLLQLANHYKINLESSILNELKIMTRRFDAKKWKSYTDSLRLKRNI